MAFRDAPGTAPELTALELLTREGATAESLDPPAVGARASEFPTAETLLHTALEKATAQFTSALRGHVAETLRKIGVVPGELARSAAHLAAQTRAALAVGRVRRGLRGVLGFDARAALREVLFAAPRHAATRGRIVRTRLRGGLVLRRLRGAALRGVFDLV
ncbi:MAG: hypothetical protein IT439_10570 [Phycisphaerales bacterium]|nr:hypothetical protein [Phycisphaerales bacterium]